MPVGELWPRANLIALYHLEDVNDSSGNANTLTNNNTVTFTKGKFSNCANFGTANTNKSLSRATNLGVTTPGNTVMFWIKQQTEIGSGAQTLCRWSNNTEKIVFYIDYNYNAGSRLLQFHRSKTGVGDVSVSASATLGIDKFHLIAMTYDGTTLRGYLNGGPVAEIATNGNGSSATTDSFVIAGDVNTFSSSFIDEFAVYNRALTYREINDYYKWASGKGARVL